MHMSLSLSYVTTNYFVAVGIFKHIVYHLITLYNQTTCISDIVNLLYINIIYSLVYLNL